MSEQRREITLSFGTACLALLLLIGQCSTNRRLERIADTADVQLCIEAVKAGVDIRTISACKDFRKTGATPAKAIEARRAETGTGSVHESAAAKPFAQTTPGAPS